MSGPTTELPGPLAALAPLLEDWGYLAVAGLVLLDNCGIPAPGQTVLVLAAVYAGTGRLSLAAVMAIAFVAASVGNSLGYLVGRTGGRAFVHRWGRYVLLTPARMERAERFFDRHGGQVVTVARFVDGLRQTNGIIAGTTGMAWRRFLPFNLLGAALWVGVWASFGYLAGANIAGLYRTAVRYQLWLLVGLAVLVAVLVVRGVSHRRRRRRDTPPGPPDAPDAPDEADGPGADAGTTDCGDPGHPDRPGDPRDPDDPGADPTGCGRCDGGPGG